MSPSKVLSAALADRIERLIAAMTPEEKAGQLSQFFVFERGSQPVDEEIAAGRAGAILFVRDPSEITRLQRIAVEESRLGIPLIFALDVIHGLRTIFPVPIAMAASWDPAAVEAAQAVAAAEARATGLHWTFAPMVDVARDPRWGRMIEGAGEDPYLGGIMAAAQVRGFQGDDLSSADRVVAGPKHLVGYGAALGGRDYDEADLSESELRNVYLPPFKAAIDAGAANIMCAYMTLNGVPATGNHWLITEILKEEWGFSGFTVSDANSAHDLAKHNFARDGADAAVRALNAGLDMEMALEAHDSVFNTLPQALAAGLIDPARLDDAVRRVLTVKVQLGLFDAPYAEPGAGVRVLGEPAHRDAARRAAERSFVLLRNEGQVLPLDPRALRKVAVIGPLADSARDTIGPWVFDHDNAETVTVLAGIRDHLAGIAEVEHATGVSIEQRLNPSFFDDIPGFDIAPLVSVDDDAGIAAAVASAKDSDVALLVLGEAQNMIGEAASRSSLDLPGRQQELLEAVIATGTPTVLLMMAARPLDLKGASPAAVLQIWYPGTQGGTAVANAVFGKIVPGGKLPFTWVRSIGQVPLHYARMVTHKPKEREMRYWNEDGTPLFPFGFGLSYTTFAYSDLVIGADPIGLVDDLAIAVTVTNTGSVAGDEVVQLYIHQRHGSAARPVRELKGFERVTLAPGESRVVRFVLSAEQRRYWSSAARGWVADATTFDVFVGGDSVASLAGTFTVAPKD